MRDLPEIVQTAWNKREAAAVLTTVGEDGTPNTIYVNWCGLMDRRHVLIGDVEFGKTLANIKEGQSVGSFLFFAPGFAAYQLKGRISYYTEGSVYDFAKSLSDSDSNLRGVLDLEIFEAFQGSQRLM